ncbi:Eco57I restriction-modification methylase domain-containing protein [Lunatimonas lonarensis]|nr:DNA methyltransferase [Lunatimonas lonarensis]
MEYYHQESLASGTRIREKLSEAVESSIKRLGNGFLKHPDNHELRAMVQSGELTGKQYYLYLLRLIYRFLFLLVTEDRSLVYPEKRDAELTRLRKIYYDFYSMDRVRKLAIRKIFVEGYKHDLWENIKITFRLFETAKYGEKLGIKPLGSGIFHPSALGALGDSKLKNEDLLFVIHRLCYFMDEERKQLVKVNFGNLDVEEFGSVYQGLLEFEPVFSELETSPSFGFMAGTERSTSGSHYTPEELVRPLIQHSLEYIIQDCLEKPEERLKLTAPNATKPTLQERALLAIKVCDISCGSGHILLSAARRIGTELAKVRTGEDQPTPTAIRQAVRDVIRECIYGVDKNPLAVELCKVALWLEAHNPGEPLNFLDHKIKCGDAIVGLAHKEELERGIADDAFKALPGDDKNIASQFRKRNKEERERKDQLSMDYSMDVNEAVNKAIEQFQLFKNLPERTPEEIEAKQKKFMELNKGTTYARLKSLADMQVAQFFIPKTADQKGYICTDATYRKYLREKTIPTGMPPAKAETLAQEKGFFHYFLEYPEVFQEGGFDCILGNPPFLGRRKITGTFGNNFLEFLKHQYHPIGAEDLVTYFFRRIFSICKLNGFLSLISTNTISQGGAREFGLDVIISKGGKINHAVSSMKWPGIAAVEVSLVTIYSGVWKGNYILNGKQVIGISTYLDSSESQVHPFTLIKNVDLSFKGSEPAGMGFILTKEEAEELCSRDKRNFDVIFPYLNGDDLNSQIGSLASRYIINFFDWELEKAKMYPDCFQIIDSKVRPERQRKKKNKDGSESTDYQLRYPLPQKYWIYGEKRPKLYSVIKDFKEVIVTARTSNTNAIEIVQNNQVLNANLTIFGIQGFDNFSILQSSLHFAWAYKFSTKLETRLIYQPSDVFETFPFPENSNIKYKDYLNEIGERYYKERKKLMFDIKLGLTKFYNLFNLREIDYSVIKNDSKKFEKDVLSFWTHFEKMNFNFSWEESIKRILMLRQLHEQMDEAVLEAYGWTDIQLRHDFYEVDYLPENDRVRYTIHPDARKEILKRLLELNHQYFEEEAKQGLHKQKNVEAFYEQKGQPVPEEVAKWFQKGKGKSKGSSSKPPKKKTADNQPDLFAATTPLFAQGSNQKIAIGSKVTIRNEEAKEMKYIIQSTGEKGSFTADGYKVILADSGLAQAMMGKMEGDKFEFGGVGYRVLKIN